MAPENSGAFLAFDTSIFIPKATGNEDATIYVKLKYLSLLKNLSLMGSRGAST